MYTHPDADLSTEQVQELSDLLVDKRQDMTDSIELLRETIMSKHDCDILDAGDSASHNEEHRRAATIARHHGETIAEIDAAFDRLGDGPLWHKRDHWRANCIQTTPCNSLGQDRCGTRLMREFCVFE